MPEAIVNCYAVSGAFTFSMEGKVQAIKAPKERGATVSSFGSNLRNVLYSSVFCLIPKHSVLTYITITHYVHKEIYGPMGWFSFPYACMCARYCAECLRNATVMTAHPLASRVNGPEWTEHTQDLSCCSAEMDEHKDHVPSSVLVPGDASVTVRPNSPNHSEAECRGTEAGKSSQL